MYDIAVIGGGPGGYVAAIRAAQLGARVLLVEKDKLGGVCLNHGCIPTKTLLNSANKWRDLNKCADFGLKAENIGFDFAAVVARKDQVIRQLGAGVSQLVKGNGIEVRYASAELLGPNILRITGADGEEVLHANRIILATGSVPAKLPVPGGDLPEVLDSDQLLSIASLPPRLAVIGAGAVGIEFATIFSSFGCEVTLVEMLPTILSDIDSDLVRRMGLILRKQGIRVIANAKVIAIRLGQEGVLVTIKMGNGVQELSVDRVLAATGRKPAVHGLGLDRAGVEHDRRGIKVNQRMETNISGIYAIGDLIGKYMWAHAASAEGIVAAESAMGKVAAMDYLSVPGCIFTTPEIATVGLTEEEAQERGGEFRIGRFNFAANGKAVSMGEAEGLIKIVADAVDGKIVGMHILGPHASDLIMEGAISLQNGLRVKDIAQTIHPHPSLSETVLESAHAVHGPSIHQMILGGHR
jgi:dihydrolipoamide dehydrogenase